MTTESIMDKNLAMVGLGLLIGMIGIDQFMGGYFRLFPTGDRGPGHGIGVVPVPHGPVRDRATSATAVSARGGW